MFEPLRRLADTHAHKLGLVSFGDNCEIFGQRAANSLRGARMQAAPQYERASRSVPLFFAARLFSSTGNNNNNDNNDDDDDDDDDNTRDMSTEGAGPVLLTDDLSIPSPVAVDGVLKASSSRSHGEMVSHI